MKAAAAEITAMSQDQIARMESTGQYQLTTVNYQLTAEDVEIATEDMPGWLVMNEGQLTIALDIELTPELIEEGVARELVNRIQNLRKSSGLEITDRIEVRIEDRDEVRDAVAHCGQYIAQQVLATSLTTAPKETLSGAEEVEMEGYTILISIKN